jgi:hypothetical protein
MGIIGKRAYRLTCPQCGAAETADTSSTLAKTEALVINGLQKEKIVGTTWVNFLQFSR